MDVKSKVITCERGWLISLFVVLFFYVSNISYSISVGKLSGPPIFDDVGYFISGIDLLEAYLSHGGWGLLRQIVEHPPHAPLSSMTAFLGFLLFGAKPLSAYIANIWCISVYAYFILRIGCPLESRLARISLLVIFLFVPASHALVNEFRPDMVAAVLFAGALYCLIFEFPYIRHHGFLWQGSLLLFAGLAAKPSALVITFPIASLSLLMAGLLRSENTGVFWLNCFLGLIRQLVPAWVLLFLFLMIWGNQTYEYIYQALVSNTGVWRTPGSRAFHWAYHSIGTGGSEALSLFLWPLALAIGIRFFRCPADPASNRAFQAYFAVLAIIYAGMSLTAEKTVFQGSFFYFTFLLLGCRAIVDMLRGYRELLRPKWLGMAVFTIALFAPVATSYSRLDPLLHLYAEGYGKVVNQLTHYIDQRDRTYGCGMAVYTLMDTNPDLFPGTSFVFAIRGLGRHIQDENTYLEQSFESARKRVEQSDIVIITPLRPEGKTQHLPGTAYISQLETFLEGRPDFRPLELTGDIGNKRVFIKKCRQNPSL